MPDPLEVALHSCRCLNCTERFVSRNADAVYCGRCTAAMRRADAKVRLANIERKLGVHPAVRVPEDAA